MSIPKCPKCDKQEVHKYAIVYKSIINKSHNESNEGPVYWIYECEECGEKFEVRYDFARVVDSPVRLTRDLEILPIRKSTDSFYED